MLFYIFVKKTGGQAKTLMLVHINPEVEALGETISTLKFAERVASIELGAARSNKESGQIREFKDEVSSVSDHSFYSSFPFRIVSTKLCASCFCSDIES